MAGAYIPSLRLMSNLAAAKSNYLLPQSMKNEYLLYTLQLQMRDAVADDVVEMTNQYIDEGFIDYAQAILMLKAILDPECND